MFLQLCTQAGNAQHDWLHCPACANADCQAGLCAFAAAAQPGTCLPQTSSPCWASCTNGGILQLRCIAHGVVHAHHRQGCRVLLCQCHLRGPQTVQMYNHSSLTRPLLRLIDMEWRLQDVGCASGRHHHTWLHHVCPQGGLPQAWRWQGTLRH